jgi:VanZ family protein
MPNIFSKYKIIFYFCNIVLVIFYLYPGSILGCFLYDDCKIQPQLTKDFIISSNHFYVFCLISILGFFTYKEIGKIKSLVIYLILLSIFLEIFHLFIPDRSFEFSDLFGNLAGSIVVILINYFIRNYVKFKN